jgi:hypothetical protein
MAFFANKVPFTEFSKEQKILLGNNESENVITLCVHIDCIHCDEALREMLNLLLISSDYRLDLIIYHSRNRKDFIFMNKLRDIAERNELDEFYQAFKRWKKKNLLFPATSILKRDQTTKEEGQQLLPEYFPYIIYNNKVVSNYSGYSNLKIALATR